MGSLNPLLVRLEVQEIQEHPVVKVSFVFDYKALLSIPQNNTPEKMCETYFSACQANNLELWLATLHPDTMASPKSKQPGPFHSLEWAKGRARWDKYRITYELSHAFATKLEGSVPVKALAYTPKYGPVPGYNEGSVMGADIEFKLMKFGGETGPWRILKASF